MNRKELIVVGVIMLLSFVGGAFGVPAVQQVFVTNFPSVQQVTVSNFPKSQNVTVTNPTNHVLTENMTVQTVSVLLTLSPTGCQPGQNCFFYNATYTVAGWRTVTISTDTSVLVVEFVTRGIVSIAAAPNAPPCAIANTVSGAFGVYPQCTIQVTGDSIWIVGNSPGHVALFLQR